ncbi:MAG: hypothetical protein GTN80_07065 [Nitrososphaeria archaeon]|nr:hypothetical protein [Nitrososphaeria archaeon]NIQ33386.1 hypothetical protein [Nitrososphaeria archaeon]
MESQSSNNKIEYLVVCIPERADIKDLVEYQVRKENPHLVWCAGYLYEYVENWSHDKPYTHFITMVNYTPLEQYKRYAVMDRGELSFSDNLQEMRGSAIPVLIEKAEENHPRTKDILRRIKERDKGPTLY